LNFHVRDWLVMVAWGNEDFIWCKRCKQEKVKEADDLSAVS